MNRPLVDRLVNALLYEGYLLYPYRPSVKNRQRWSFGGLYPPSYTERRIGSDASSLRTECLAMGNGNTSVSITVRYLQLVARRVAPLDPPRPDWPIEPSTPLRFVESLCIGEDVIHSWQEAIEREIPLSDARLEALATCRLKINFHLEPAEDREPIRDESGLVAGVIERERGEIKGKTEASAVRIDDGVYRVAIEVANQTPHAADPPEDRDAALMHALVSTHTILGISDGIWISLMDPPESLRWHAESCRNVGTWPVLVGNEGEADTMLSSPIILHDYPQVAPESPGDLFDSTEIDEILTLRIMTLSDEEKRMMAALDPKGRALLERTEALARGELMGLHGTFRAPRPRIGGPTHGSLE
jgi:hypothetical protein